VLDDVVQSHHQVPATSIHAPACQNVPIVKAQELKYCIPDTIFLSTLIPQVPVACTEEESQTMCILAVNRNQT